jgi:hypothetical protein
MEKRAGWDVRRPARAPGPPRDVNARGQRLEGEELRLALGTVGEMPRRTGEPTTGLAAWSKPIDNIPCQCRRW